MEEAGEQRRDHRLKVWAAAAAGLDGAATAAAATAGVVPAAAVVGGHGEPGLRVSHLEVAHGVDEDVGEEAEALEHGEAVLKQKHIECMKYDKNCKTANFCIKEFHA